MRDLAANGTRTGQRGHDTMIQDGRQPMKGLSEGTIKGGVKPPPTTPRPQSRPAGQRPRIDVESMPVDEQREGGGSCVTSDDYYECMCDACGFKTSACGDACTEDGWVQDDKRFLCGTCAQKEGLAGVVEDR